MPSSEFFISVIILFNYYFLNYIYLSSGILLFDIISSFTTLGMVFVSLLNIFIMVTSKSVKSDI